MIVIFVWGKHSAVVPDKQNHDLATLGYFINDNSLIVTFKKSKTEYLLFGSHHKLAKTALLILLWMWEKSLWQKTTYILVEHVIKIWKRIEKVQHRALKIINGRHGTITFPAIKSAKDKRCAIEVFKCLNGLAPNLFENYFCKKNHKKGTRGNNARLVVVVVPPIRTEAARKTFYYQGTQIYN